MGVTLCGVGMLRNGIQAIQLSHIKHRYEYYAYNFYYLHKTKNLNIEFKKIIFINQNNNPIIFSVKFQEFLIFTISF